MPPFFAYHMPSFTFPGVPDDRLFERVADRAVAAERAGFDAVTVMDHFYQIAGVGAEDEPMLEAYATLGALAARTSSVLLGTLVTGVTYRNPALLAKTVTTIDVISGGRALYGIGAAWNETEHLGYGFEFPPIRERMDRLGEALEIARLMFTEERPSFEGRHYSIERALNSPRPVQAGGPRILIGGGGEQRTLKLVARYADISNWFGTFEDSTRKLDVLARHCEAEGRDPATIIKTVLSPVVFVEHERDIPAALERIPPDRRAMMQPATASQAVDRLGAYLEAGIGGFTFRNAHLPTPELIAIAGDVRRQLSQAGPGQERLAVGS